MKRLKSTESGRDPLEWLGPDAASAVIQRLDDPKDPVRLAAVSKSWRRFVISNGFCKKLCLRRFPEVSNFIHVAELSSPIEAVQVGSSSATEWMNREIEHMAYSYLSYCFAYSVAKHIYILDSIGASSTERYPDKRIENTMDPRDIIFDKVSYWSSKGERDPEVPETLTYRLSSKLCVVSKINIKPYRELFHDGNLIYSAEAVRFRMGHPLPPQKGGTCIGDKHATNQEAANFMWTYVSPKFPMVQENVLQAFELPNPVLCIGGIVQIEFLGRVQKYDINGMYYIRVSYVQVIGYPLSPVFDVDLLGTEHKFTLKYFPKAKD